MTQWQPIETAPRDGTEILLSNGKDVFVGLYGWMEEGEPVFYYDGPGYRDVTHWTHLPEPPA